MNSIEMVYCVSEVYDSSKANEFTDFEKYPIAWEVIFRNDKAGKQLVENVYAAMEQFPKEHGYVLGLDGEQTDIARCLECVFKDEHSFNRLLNKALNGIALYDEDKKQIIPRQELVDNAKNIGTVVELVF